MLMRKLQYLHVNYKINLQEICCVLNQATRQYKQEMMQAWQEIIGQIPSQRRAKLRTSEVLAIGTELA